MTKFMKGKINTLACVNAGGVGYTYRDVDNFLITQINSNGKVMVITIAFLAFTTVVLFGLFWLFYRVLYGILLRRLYANYKELKKIDL